MDCVIQLPDNLFFGTSIATCIMVLKKCRAESSTLFINASRECIKVTNSNKMTEANIATILKAYENRTDAEYFAKLVDKTDIAEQGYNLTVSTYVAQEDTREIVNIDELNAEIEQIATYNDVLRQEIDAIVAEIKGGA